MPGLCLTPSTPFERACHPPIIFHMTDKTPADRSSIESDFRKLEKQVDELIAALGALQEENRALRQRQDVLATERASLVQRNEQVRTRVEAMIGRLKTLEHGA